MAAASRLLNGLLRSRRLSSSSLTAILRPLPRSLTHGPRGAFFLPPPPSVRSFATVSTYGDDDDDVGSRRGDAFLPVKLAVSMLDSYHDLTGLPWWIVTSSSTLAMRVALLPVLVLQLRKVKRISEKFPKLPPPLPPPFSGRSYIKQLSLFRSETRATGCPSLLWFLSSISVQIPCFLLWMTTIRRMCLDHHRGFDSISFTRSEVREVCGLFGILAKSYRWYLEALSFPLIFIGCSIPQQVALKDPAVCRKLGLAMKEPSEALQNTREVVTSKLESSNLNDKNKRISIENMSPRELHNLSVMCVGKAMAGAANLFCGNNFRNVSTHLDLPKKLGRSGRKPMARTVNELKREARADKKLRQTAQEIVLDPPANGLLVKELVPLARRVYTARANLFACVSRVAESIPIYSCSLCGEVHVGHPPHQIRSCDVRGSLPSKEHTWQRVGMEHVLPVVKSFHLYDRVGRAVSHEEQLQVDRIPAVVELCVQAGIDIPEYPTRRRMFPVYNVSGRVIDFERRFPKDDSPGQDINTYGFWDRRKKFGTSEFSDLQFKNLRAAAEQGLKEWENLSTGAAKLMEKYTVQTCGYCSEVQVGPKGHRVRNCVAYKHQMRDGQHAWQEARTEDILPPVYVWHARGGNGVGKLENGLKWYYGKLPAVVELFSQAGARVGEKYAALMREDVAVPDMEEVNFVV